MVYAKTLSWAVLSGLLIAGSALCETGDLRGAVLTAVWAVSLKTPFYSLHEVLWNGKQRQQA